MTDRRPRMVCALLLALVGLAGSGCQRHANRLSITSYRHADHPELFYQDFDQAWFSRSKGGVVELLLESGEPVVSFGQEVFRQQLYARVFWRAIPGKTFAERSQINARIVYDLWVAPEEGAQVTWQKPGNAIHCQGSGFISFQFDRKQRVMRGTIEQALLTPQDRSSAEEFGKVMIRGTFVAREGSQHIADYRVTRREDRE